MTGATDHPAASCANCGTQLTGRYCHACGQAGRLHRSLPHLCEEFLHGVLHFDAKAWRTLPLLISQPGVLTRRYIDGQRMRYVSPLALFLFTVFLMFFVVSIAGGPTASAAQRPAQLAEARADLRAQLKQADAATARALAALAAARAGGGDEAAAERSLSDAQTDQRITSMTLKTLDVGALKSSGGGTDAAAAEIAKHIDTGHPALDATLRRQLANPELFLYKLRTTAYKLSFMLIPISLPFLWLMFAGRPGVTLYDHAVFSLYSLSFMSLLIIASVLVGRIGLPSLAACVIVAVPPVHMFRQLQQTYRLGFGAALWRTLALLAVAGTAFIVFLLLVLLIIMQ